jgi:hypothetical protein
VLCSGYEHEYETVVRFLASSCAGHKVKFCLVLQTFKEQAGKGSVLNFMAELLGKRMHKTSSCEEVVKFSKNFEGRTLINLDEVPVAGSIKEFQDVMKSLITENTFNCRAMHKQGYQQQNTFNVIFCSNNNCVLLTQSNNARYYVPTCSDKYAGNVHKPYFDKLHKYLKNEDVKVAIFQEFMRIYEEEVKPIDWRTPTNNVTEAGKLKIIEALPKIIKFIKNDYLFKGHDIDETCSGLLDEYKRKYPSDNPHPNVFGYNLGLLNITAKRIQNKTFNGRKYIMDYATLKQEFIKKNWLVDEELEELEIMEENKGITPKPSTKRLCDILDHDCQQNDEDEEIKIDYEQLYKQQLDKLKALEKEMTELKSNSIILAKPPNVEPLLNSIKKFKNIVLPAKEDEYIDEEDIDDLLSMIRAN